MTGVPTGFADLDALTNGLHPGQMIIVAARPAVGKSALALDFARAASIQHDLPSVIFSLEMSRNEIAMRLLSAEAQRGAATTCATGTHDRRGLDHGWPAGWARSPPRRCSSTTRPNMTMMEIRAKCRRLKQRTTCRLVVIDYLQLMTSRQAASSRASRRSPSSPASLKLLAKELEVPVIALSQLNRGAEQRTDKKPHAVRPA